MRSQSVLVKKFLARTGQGKERHVTIENNTIYLHDGTNRVYRPSPSGELLHTNADKDEVMGIMGPFNSGKSTICLMDSIIQASLMPRCIDGVRRFKLLIVRNTTAQLLSSAYESWWKWNAKLGDGEPEKRFKPFLHIIHRFNDGFGLIELELVFMPCDTIADADKFRSTEFTNAYVNEASELPEFVINVLKTRLGRYPAKHMCPDLYKKDKKFKCKLILDTNPPDTDHWIYRVFEVDRPKGYKLIKQPSGLIRHVDSFGKVTYETNEEADNISNIEDGFYLRTSRGAPEEFIKVFCMGLYGVLRNSKLIYPMYIDDLHSTEEILFDPKEPLVYLGWDFGLTPAVIVCQYIDKQLRVIKEFVTENCSVSELLQTFKPYYNSQLENYAFLSYCDPSDRGSDADNVTCRQRLKEFGFVTQKAKSNNTIERLDAVKYFLSVLNYGKPGILISRKGCPSLRKGFLGDYHFKRVNVLSEERYQDVPNKLHPYSDIHDCLQYVALQLVTDTKKEKISLSKEYLEKFMDRSRSI